MNVVTIVSIIVLVLAGVDGVCEDEVNTITCNALKAYCTNMYARWSSGPIFYQRCRKTCDRCLKEDTEADEAADKEAADKETADKEAADKEAAAKEAAEKEAAAKEAAAKEAAAKEAAENGTCKDTYGACERYKHICKCGVFGDGTKFWSVCMGTCKCCDGSCAAYQKQKDAAKKEYEESQQEKQEEKEAEEEKEREEEEQKKEEEADPNCKDMYSSCKNYGNICKTGTWGDGQTIWKKCEKTCDCCGGKCDAEEAAKQGACGESVETIDQDFFKQDILDRHNRLRALHQIPADLITMTWDDTLQGYAQTHSDYMAASGTFDHSDKNSRPNAGENLMMGSLMRGKVCSRVGSQATQAWYDEIKDWDFSTSEKKAGTVTGHFTQVVWTTSTKLGCAFAFNGDMKNVYVTCTYSGPGNYVGQYAAKVMPLKTLRMLEKRQTIVIPERSLFMVNVPANKRDEPEPVIVMEVNERQVGIIIPDPEEQ